MAQGFVRNLNLQESQTTVSDRGILDNLGGLGSSNDIQLFIGNSRFKSALINDPNFTAGTATFFGDFVAGKKYKITSLGEGRSWGLVTSDPVSVGATITATADGANADGSGGTAVEVIGRRDFNSVNILGEGWTVTIVFGNAKVAYTEGTKVSLDKGATYTHVVTNSDGITRFQLKSLADDSILNLSDVSNMTITRSDEVTTDNISNLYVERLSNTDAGLEGEETIADPFSRVSTISGNLGGFPGKRDKVVRSYLPDNFSSVGQESGLRFGGVIRIKNNPDSSNHVISIGNPTPFGELIVSEPYQIKQLGNTPQIAWDAIGANKILETAPEITSPNFVTDTVYKITSLGSANLGPTNNGNFVWDSTKVNSTNHTIDLGAGHGLVVNDVIKYYNTTGSPITGLTHEGTYFVHTVDGNNIKLKATLVGEVEPIAITEDPPQTGNNYSLIVDPQNRWNAIAGTTGILYAVGSLFQASSNGSTITGAKAKIAQFQATGKGTTGTTGTATPLEAPGLFILNQVNGRAVRAFTAKDNPWEEVSSLTIGSLTFDALKTTSNIAQAQNFLFKRKDSTAWGSFIPTEKYKITDTGSGRNWTQVGCSVANPNIGDTFTASAAGPSGTGSGGFALGTPKILLTNTAQTDLNNSAIQTESNLIASYTHTIPVNINGEKYYLLTKAGSSGEYKVLVIN